MAVLEDQLRAIPFLRDLPEAAVAAAAAWLEPVHLSAGSQLFAAGDPADALYLVAAGRLQVVDGTGERLLATLGPGSVVGELGLLLDTPRSGTVQTIAAADLYRLSRERVEALIAEHPGVAVALGREVGRHLIASSQRDAEPPRLVVVPGPGASALTSALRMARVDGVAVLPLPGSGTPPDDADLLGGEVLSPEGVLELVSRPRAGLSVVVACLPTDPDPVSQATVGVADHGVAVGSALPRWAADAISPLRRLAWGGGTEGAQRIARWVSGRAIGLALSSGGSKTCAHVGVVRALREAGVVIDAVAGSSGGSVVAAAVAAGFDTEGLVARMSDLPDAFRLRRLGPNLPPRYALFKGTGPLQLFQRWFGDSRIEDQAIPLFIVATDVETGAEVDLDRGPVAGAIRASIGIPAVLSPWPWEGRHLVDGGIVAPMPARVLRDAGIRWVIGSNVAGQDFINDEGPVPKIIDMIGRMVSTMERAVLTSQVALLDVHIRPLVRAGNSFDFEPYERFVAEGERAAREQFPAIEHLLAQTSAR